MHRYHVCHAILDLSTKFLHREYDDFSIVLGIKGRRPVATGAGVGRLGSPALQLANFTNSLSIGTRSLACIGPALRPVSINISIFHTPLTFLM